MNAPDGVDDAFRQRMSGVFGDDGEAWLAELPQLIDEYARRSRLTLGEPFVPLGYNYVVRATRVDGTPVVLRAGVPRDDLRFEMEALRHFAGRASVRLLDADAVAGVSLLERAVPGTPILLLDDDAEGTRIAARLMRKLWRAPGPGHALPTVREWGSAFAELRSRHGGGSGPLPPALFDHAESLYFALDASREREVVLLATCITGTSSAPSGSRGWRSTLTASSAIQRSRSAPGCAIPSATADTLTKHASSSTSPTSVGSSAGGWTSFPPSWARGASACAIEALRSRCYRRAGRTSLVMMTAANKRSLLRSISGCSNRRRSCVRNIVSLSLMCPAIDRLLS